MKLALTILPFAWLDLMLVLLILHYSCSPIIWKKCSETEIEWPYGHWSYNLASICCFCLVWTCWWSVPGLCRGTVFAILACVRSLVSRQTSAGRSWSSRTSHTKYDPFHNSIVWRRLNISFNFPEEKVTMSRYIDIIYKGMVICTDILESVQLSVSG